MWLRFIKPSLQVAKEREKEIEKGTDEEREQKKRDMVHGAK